MIKHSFMQRAGLPALLAALWLSAPHSAVAQQIVATTIVDGQKVELLDNNSWRFVQSQDANSDCSVIAGDVTFCGNRKVWRVVAPPNPQIAAAFMRTEVLFGLVVSEGVGSDVGISIEALRKVAIQNAANGAGVLPENVTVSDSFTSESNGMTYETIAYSVKVNGVPLVFLNSLFVGPKRSLQLITYELDPNLTDYHKGIHQEFLDETKVAQ